MANIEIAITEKEAGERLDVVLSRRSSDISRAAIQQAIRAGHCLVDGRINRQPASKTRTAQKIILALPRTENALEPLTFPVDIIWQDENIAVCAKPAGISVHPCPSCAEPTFVQYLLARFPQLKLQDGPRPGIVHRLDKDTSGLMLVALSEAARLKLSNAFAERQIHKEYLALVQGKPPDEGTCLKAVGRHPTIKTRMAVVDENRGGKPAHTSWRLLWHFENDISLLAVKIHTGRTHQIRVHLAHLGYPIIGDKTYGNHVSGLMAPRQMLHAWKISLAHPFGGESLNFTAPPPEDFIHAALAAQNRMQKIIITGNQGCGKSAFCEELYKRNIPVVSADDIVARLYSPGGQAAEWLKFRFGENILEPDGAVDKSALFKIMHTAQELRKEVETCIHSLVRREIETFFERNEVAGVNIAAAEIPLFFESGLRHNLGPGLVTVGIHCPKELRWRRIGKNRGWTEEKIISIEQWQMDESSKMASCDYVVQNVEERRNLESEADKLLEWLQSQKKISREALKKTLADFWKS